MSGQPNAPRQDDDIRLGARLRIRRVRLGLSQSDLGHAIGVTFQQVQKYERGANRVAGARLIACAKALETTVAALVGEDGTETATDQLIDLTTPGAVALLRAYARLEPPVQRAVLAVAQAALAPDPLPVAVRLREPAHV